MSKTDQSYFVPKGTIKRLGKSILRAPEEVKMDADSLMKTFMEREGYLVKPLKTDMESTFHSHKHSSHKDLNSTTKWVKETLLNSTHGHLQSLMLPRGPSLKKYADGENESESKRKKAAQNLSTSGLQEADYLLVDNEVTSPSKKSANSPSKKQNSVAKFAYGQVITQYKSSMTTKDAGKPSPAVPGTESTTLRPEQPTNRTGMSLFDHNYRLKSKPGGLETTLGSSKHITSQVESQSEVLVTSNQPRSRQPVTLYQIGQVEANEGPARIETHDEFFYRSTKYFVPFDTVPETRPVLAEKPPETNDAQEDKFYYSPNRANISAFASGSGQPFSFKEPSVEVAPESKLKRVGSLVLSLNKVGSRMKLPVEGEGDPTRQNSIASINTGTKSVSQPPPRYHQRARYDTDSPSNIKLTTKQITRLLEHNKKTMRQLESAAEASALTKYMLMDLRQEQFQGKIDTVTKKLKIKSMAGTVLFAHGKNITQETEGSNPNSPENHAVPDIPINEIIDAIEVEKMEKRNSQRSKSVNILDGDNDGQNQASSESRLPFLKKSATGGAIATFLNGGLEEPKKLYSLDDLRNPADFECAIRYLPPSSHNTNSTKGLPPSRERMCSVMVGGQSSNSVEIAGNGARIIMFGGLGSECFSEMWTNNCIGLPTLNPNAYSTYTPAWTPVPAEAGSLVARFEASMNLYNSSTLILFGGKSNKGRTYTVRTNDLFVLSDQKWNRIAWEDDAPIPRSSHASVIVGEWLIVFGGINQDDELLFDGFGVRLTGIDKKNRVFMNWLTFKNETTLNGLSHHKMCLVADPEDNKSVLIPFHRVEKLKPRTARGGAEKAIYVFGGMCTNTGAGSRELYMIRIFATTFVFRRVETVGKKPRPRIGHSMHYIPRIESILIMFGKDPTSLEYLSSVSMISLINMNWYKVKMVANSLVAPPRGFHCSHVDERSGKIFIFGGVNDQGFLTTAFDSFQMVPILKQKDSPKKISPPKLSISKQEKPA